ncbi:protein-glutamate methylesterase/protein-glutamine glutaminase [Chromobacterium amazonense]|uniref:Protein-glutamate methylesterase/protein-glutamine glutaminase n=1 Tax=Chromobacterium amazonense TaxID=1382803 RepID=A0A1S1XET5_9NEIS|nr:chemotaxis response regulator protein-glutamate methylesterase [Chromobacterium amazonense]MDE1711726.1 chemotaxis response regulator protein-glutamate methylesterase [Chromobacterium amazonense]OHX18412.1 chemotaxis response regulator protein-glutamate methylesterase [Chromobacterium amazonense]PRP71076.1 chemotaxis response regulator protein-glutamate methylesterase [Chromobacterium amazonense]
MSIAVLIVDDSAVVREILTQMLSSAPDIEVMGAAPDPIFAMTRMKARWPDVIVLDIEMPRMDGLTFLRKIMDERPTPVIICSSLTEKGARITLDAMSAGAVAVITKPTINLKSFLQEAAKDLIQEVRNAARARMGVVKRMARPAERGPGGEIAPKLTADVVLEAPSGLEKYRTTEKIIAIGTSTGGTQALEYLLPRLPATCPGVAVVQHMPEKFTASFANRLNSLCNVEVWEAKNGDRLSAGVALIAPGGKHLLIKRSGAQYVAEVKDGPLVSRHRPSVDVLFRSVALCAGSNAVGVIMTGMGDDGARGMREMHDTGARTIAQDEESCVVFGMPAEAIDHGGVDEVMSLERIAHTLAGIRG